SHGARCRLFAAPISGAHADRAPHRTRSRTGSPRQLGNVRDRIAHPDAWRGELLRDERTADLRGRDPRGRRGGDAAGACRGANDLAGGRHRRGTHRDHREVVRSEEHTSELQSRFDLVCRLLLEKKKKKKIKINYYIEIINVVVECKINVAR